MIFYLMIFINSKQFFGINEIISMKYSKLILKSLVIAVSIALTACNEHRGHLHVHATNTGGKLGESGVEGTPPIPSPKPELPLPVEPFPEPV
ncbi:hypothetical protein BGI40_07225 [Snodgrassella communis]|nr:hypothetical protein BGI39_04240 [Snodgrassella communis]PIT29979.1 hypothetical protein BGI38_02495 [Snodgrassella communis]PIT33461.1 hypothetical protein BGI40_07225 [Snodgrassella communis]